MKNTVTKQFLIALILIFVLQTFMLIYIFNSFYRSSVTDIKDLGESNMNSQATMVENYLNKGVNVLWFAAGSVDYMMKNGETNDEILNYLAVETKQMQEKFDENFTGIYGYINGEYIDGSGWIPPEDYDPLKRSWYTEALEVKGEMVISQPYVDAQTGEIVISLSQMLSDEKSVISLDIVLNGVQSIVEEMSMGSKGYGFIVDSKGLVIAHGDKGEIGKDYSLEPEMAEILSGIYSNPRMQFETTIDGKRCSVFSDLIAKDWYIVIIAENALLFQKLRIQLLTGIILSLIIFTVIVIFCTFSVKKIVRAEKAEQESADRLQRMNLNAIRSLASAIDAKDRYTSGHSRRVAEYSLMIAQRMGKTQEEQRIIYNAGLLHDIGKIRVPEEVINKPGKLTKEEFDQIRIHSVSGYHILSGIHEDERVRYGSKYHHERYDGNGYPNGLKGEDIPEIARIIAVADAYDAMTSDRSYRGALEQNVVREEIVKGKGTQFDPEIADKMLEIIDEDTGYDIRQRDDGIFNVLVIDDEQIIIMDVKRILSDMKRVCVFGAGTVEDADSMLRNLDISVILLDLKMPEIDGFTLYEKIREKYQTPVIMMTGDRSAETLKRIEELNIDDYLTKPLNGAITREVVHSILQRTEGTVWD